MDYQPFYHLRQHEMVWPERFEYRTNAIIAVRQRLIHILLSTLGQQFRDHVCGQHARESLIESLILDGESLVVESE